MHALCRAGAALVDDASQSGAQVATRSCACRGKPLGDLDEEREVRTPEQMAAEAAELRAAFAEHAARP